ncbi:MAG: hypothetical protein GX845_02645 [Erysipelothrix sp.]|nr:hypothetical protein [Erysipelothrix sp.]
MEVKIPDAFVSNQDIDDDLMVEYEGEIIKVGTFEFDHTTNIVTLIFDETIKNKDIEVGYFGFEMSFSSEFFEDNVRQKIEFDDVVEKEFDIIAEPEKMPASAISKMGQPDSEINPSSIVWTVDVFNLDQDTRSGEFTDILPEGLALVAGSVKLISLDIGIKGDITPVTGGTVDVADAS